MTTKHRMSRVSRAARRGGLTLLEMLVVGVILALLVALLFPVIFLAIERVHRHECASNLRQVGVALLSYHTNRNHFPPVDHFAENLDVPWSASWWLDVLEYTELKQVPEKWISMPGDGDFNGVFANPNINLVEGFYPRFLSCPASELPLFTDPNDLSDFTAALVVPGPPRGIFVPSYVAISGSAPDMRGLGANSTLSEPHGRNTRDGRYGILSGSGVFPPRGHVSIAMIQRTDGTGQVLMAGEQSGWNVEHGDESSWWADQRSGWPRGMFTGSEAMYGPLSPEAEGLDGDGDARIFNATTIRYPINTRAVTTTALPGIVVQTVEIPPRSRADSPRLRGPGHNHGIFSAHEGGAHALFADGRVEFLDQGMDLTILKQLSTIDDGEVVKDYGAAAGR